MNKNMLEQAWDSIIKDSTNLKSLITDREKLVKFNYLSNAIINVDLDINFLKHFLDQNIPSVEYDALLKAWGNLKEKINFLPI